MGDEFPIGTNIRVCGRGDELNGLVGKVKTRADCYGRYGVHLPEKPRKHAHWFHWVHPDFLEPWPAPAPGPAAGNASKGDDT